MGPEANDKSKLTYALEHVARQWFIFPVEPGDKVPLILRSGRPIRWSEWATNSPVRVVEYWTKYPAANIGVACAPSGLLVVDCDPPNGVNTWLTICTRYAMTDACETYTVITGSGGLHLYYRWDNRMRASNAPLVKDEIDIRCNGGQHGGYVLGDGSITSKGKYTYQGGQLLDPPPQLVVLVKEPEKKPVKPVDEFYQAGNYQGMRDAVMYAGEGNRNNMLNWATWKLRAEGATEQQVIQELTEPALIAGLTPGEITRTIHSAYARTHG